MAALEVLDFAEPPKPGGRRGSMLLAGLAAVVVVGVGAFFLLDRTPARDVVVTPTPSATASPVVSDLRELVRWDLPDGRLFVRPVDGVSLPSAAEMTGPQEDTAATTAFLTSLGFRQGVWAEVSYVNDYVGGHVMLLEFAFRESGPAWLKDFRERLSKLNYGIQDAIPGVPGSFWFTVDRGGDASSTLVAFASGTLAGVVQLDVRQVPADDRLATPLSKDEGVALAHLIVTTQYQRLR